ncbi:MAG: metallophosphoesterase family protein [Oscillochloridaceae bacterium umkhey_bin13]
MDKIALLADIHGNLAALEAVIADLERWQPDTVIVAGDIINRGPQSGACLDLCLRLAAERGWHLMRGNHERYILSYDRDHRDPSFPQSGPRYELMRGTAWTHAQVAHQIATLAALPEQVRIALGHDETLVVYHASVRHDRDGMYAKAAAQELHNQIEPTATIFAVGHTHMPFVRRLGPTLIVNTGAVGLPFDGDRRAAYARLQRRRTGWQAQIRRLDYDYAATLHSFRNEGMLVAVGALGPLMLREIETGQSLIFSFIPTYHAQITAGVISFDAAVHEFLAHNERVA